MKEKEKDNWDKLLGSFARNDFHLLLGGLTIFFLGTFQVAKLTTCSGLLELIQNTPGNCKK